MQWDVQRGGCTSTAGKVLREQGSERGAGCQPDLGLGHGALEHEVSSAGVGSPATWFSLNYLCDFYQV